MQVGDLVEFLGDLSGELDEGTAASVGPALTTLTAPLSALASVGLGYLSLDRPAGTLSGGERHRAKLASRIDGDAPVIVLDERTTGLHLADTATPVEMMQKLVDAGHTLIVI